MASPSIQQLGAPPQPVAECSGHPAPVRALYLPDLTRAHGAWIYLAVSVGVGALVGTRQGVEPPLLCGSAFAGAYLGVAALLSARSRRWRQVLLGACVGLTSPLLALAMGAHPAFLSVLPFAALSAVAVAGAARRLGALAPASVATGVLSLTLCAPAAALAGGASPARALGLLALLAPVFAWRALRLAGWLRARERWDREQLRALGLREAGFAALWGLVVVLILLGTTA